MVEEDMILGDLKDLQHLQNLTYTKEWSMVVIRDSSLNGEPTTGDDFSVFPPRNHENLTPHSNNPATSPYSPSSPLSFVTSDCDLPPSPPPPPPSPSPPPPPPSQESSVSPVSGWWSLAFQILRSKIVSFGSCLRYNGGNRSSFWSMGNVGLAVVVVMWWLSVRVRRRWRRESVRHLTEVIRQKDEKIIKLLNQIAQMNELLLARHKVQASKVAG